MVVGFFLLVRVFFTGVLLVQYKNTQPLVIEGNLSDDDLQTLKLVDLV